MKLYIAASGSKGNCYILDNGQDKLLLDCGVSLKEIKKALDFDLNVRACLLTHIHADHSKSAKDLMGCGIDVYSSFGTHTALDSGRNHRAVHCSNLKTFLAGSFQVMPFTVEHDCIEPFGYVIQDMVSGQRVLFATDTAYLRFNFKKIDHYLIECNYDDETIAQNAQKGSLDEFRYKRIVESHMGLNTLIEAIKSHKSTPKTITLIHLSDQNINEKKASSKIYAEFGLLPSIADAGVTIDLT